MRLWITNSEREESVSRKVIMKGPVFITLFSLVLFLSITESRRERNVDEWRNEIKEESVPEAVKNQQPNTRKYGKDDVRSKESSSHLGSIPMTVVFPIYHVRSKKLLTQTPNTIKMVTEIAHDSEEINPMNDDQHNHSWEHMNSSLINMVFFTIEDLKLDKKRPFYFPLKHGHSSYLPKEIADSMPFSLKQLPEILSSFSFPKGSPQAQAVETALWVCELQPIRGEIRICPTSLESMLDSARSILGLPKNSPIKNLTTSHLTNPHAIFQNYTLSQMPKQIAVPKVLVCHALPYPYAVHLCHFFESETKLMVLPLEGDNGDRVEAVAVCHMDTSDWSPDYPPFRKLKIKRGSPVCHVVPETDLVLMSP